LDFSKFEFLNNHKSLKSQYASLRRISFEVNENNFGDIAVLHLSGLCNIAFWIFKIFNLLADWLGRASLHYHFKFRKTRHVIVEIFM